MPYTKNKLENGFEFDIRPEEAPQVIGTLLLACLFHLSALMCVSIVLVPVVGALIAGIGYLVQKSSNYTRFRLPPKFKVTSDGISLSDKFYDNEDIQRIIIRNHVDKYEYIPAVTIRPSNYGATTGLSARFKMKEQLINVS